MSESMANALRAAARLRDIAHQVSELGQHYFAPPSSFQLLRYDSLNIVTCGLHKRRRFQVRRGGRRRLRDDVSVRQIPMSMNSNHRT